MRRSCDFTWNTVNSAVLSKQFSALLWLQSNWPIIFRFEYFSFSVWLLLGVIRMGNVLVIGHLVPRITLTFHLLSRMPPSNRYAVPARSIFRSTPLNEIGTTYLQIVFTETKTNVCNEIVTIRVWLIKGEADDGSCNAWNSPNEFRKSVIRFMLAVITSMYSRLAQSWWICFWIASRCTPDIMKSRWKCSKVTMNTR